MRKTNIFLLSFLMALLALPVKADFFSVGDLQYITTGDNNSVEVSGYNNRPTELVIPSTLNYAGKNYSVVGIRAGSLAYCTTLESVTLGDNISSISPSAFDGCIALTNIYASEGNMTFEAKDGILYSEDLKTLWLYPFGRTSEEIAVKDGVETIASRVFFRNKTISSVVLPETLKSIEESAFSLCTSLTSIIIPQTVKSIGTSAFSGCRALNTITIQGMLSDIGTDAFASTAIESIELNTTLSYIPARLFGYCQSLKSVILPSSIVSLGDEAFAGCTSMESFPFSSNLQEIGTGCFSGDSKLKQANLSDTRLISLESSVFYGCSALTSVTLPSNLQNIGSYAFQGCTQLTKLTLPNSLKSIGDGAFSNMGLMAIELPEGVTSLPNCLLQGNKDLIEFKIPDSVVSMGEMVFAGCISLEEMVIPERFTSIPNSMFFGCCSLKKISMSSTLTTIGASAFEGCSGLESINIPQTVNEIGAYCFQNCTSLKEIDIPVGIKEISTAICSGCTNLKKVSMGLNRYWQTGSSWIEGLVTGEMREDAFKGCTALEELHVLDILVPWGIDQAFTDVDLTNVSLYIPIETTNAYNSEWGTGRFKECIEEESANSIVFIAQGYTCARKPEAMQKVYLISSPSWRDFRYEGDVVIPENITYANEKLTIVGMLGYSSNMFRDLTSIELPKTIETLGGENAYGWEFDMHLFSYCNKLKSISVAEGCENYFSYRGALYEKNDSALLYVPISLTEADTLVTCYEIPEGVKEIIAFNVSYDKCNIKRLSIPSTMKNIRQDAFSNTFIDTVYIYATTPPGRPHMRDDGYGGFGILYVPYNCKAAYQEAYNTDPNNTPSWPAIQNIIEMPSDEPVSYMLTYFVDGEEYAQIAYLYGEMIKSEPYPFKEGHTFSGWIDLPETMPANDVTVTGSFTINTYQITYIVDDEVVRIDSVEYGKVIMVPDAIEREGYTFDGWSEVPETMPAKDIIIYGSYTSGIRELLFTDKEVRIYNSRGQRIPVLHSGVNIIRTRDGRTKKMVVK